MTLEFILITLNLILSGAIMLVLYRQLKQIDRTYNGKTVAEIYEESLNDADSNARTIMEEAAVKAKLILNDTKSFKETIENYAEKNLKDKYNEFEKELTTNSEEIIKLYDGFFGDIKTEIQKKEKNLLTKIDKDAAKTIDGIDAKVNTQVTQLIQNLQKNLDKELVDSKTAISEYRESQKKEIDARILAEVQRLSKKIFSSTLTNEQHEEVIMKALEQAKKEGLFV